VAAGTAQCPTAEEATGAAGATGAASGEQQPASALSPEEVEARLRQAARILVAGAVRAAVAKKRSAGEGAPAVDPLDGDQESQR
jgi:hypothetical protein